MGYTSNGPDNETGFYSFVVYELKTPMDKVYVGYTHHAACKRFQQHIKNSRKTKGKCLAIEAAIRKYGFENITVKTLMKCWSQYDAGKWETNIIAEMKSAGEFGYNLTIGGDGGPPNAETKQKISESQRGKTHSEETKKNMSESRRGDKHPQWGKTLSDENKQKLSEANRGEKNPMYGKIRSEETKQKIREATIGEKHNRSKRVYQYDLKGNFIDSFGSTEEAARRLGKTNGSNIRKCARGNKGYKTVYGFKWSYIKTQL
jgi:group I intron endonuclease